MGIVFDTYHSLEGLALGDTRAPLVMGIVFDTREGEGLIVVRALHLSLLPGIVFDTYQCLEVPYILQPLETTLWWVTRFRM